MKRPFAVIGFTFFFVVLVLFLSESIKAAYYAFFAFTAIGSAALFNKNLRQAMTVPVCLFAGAAACLLFIAEDSQISSAQTLTGENVRVEAVVAERPYLKKESGRHYCVLELLRVGTEKVSGRLRLSFSPSKDSIAAESLEIGNKLSFTGTVYIPGEAEKSISRYFAGESIVLGAYSARDVSIYSVGVKSLTRIFAEIRHSVSQRLRYGFGDRVAGLIVGILTGDKACLDGKLYDSFKKTGIAHLMAVSGLHLSLWVFSLGALIPENGKASRLKYILLALAVAFIMLLAGMSESVKRAGFMSLVFLLGKLCKRKSDGLNSLGIAVTLMLLYNPACVLSTSMQLSFLSTLGILTLGKQLTGLSADLFGGKKINTPLKKALRSCADVFFISISVLVFTFPVLIYSFGGISAVSAFVNVFVSFAVMPLLLLSGAYALLAPLSFIAYPIALAVRLLAEYIIAVARFFLSFRNAFLVFERENLFLYAAGAIIVFFLCLFALKKNSRSLGALILCLVLSSAFIIADNVAVKENVRLHSALCNGCGMLAVEKDGQAVLLSEAGEYEKSIFISLLEEKGVTVYAEADAFGQAFLKSTADGKYISAEDSSVPLEGVSLELSGKEQCISAFGKDIHIFYSEALQCSCDCDIIIKLTDNDATVSVGESSFSLEKEGSLTLVLTENKTVLRGKSKWLNLMKSS